MQASEVPLDPRHRFLLRRELKVLRLGLGERVLWAGAVTYGRREGLLAATNQRVFFLRSRLFGSLRRSWDNSLVERIEVHVKDTETATITMKAATAHKPHHFEAARRDAKAFAAAVASLTGASRQQVRTAVDERLARLDRMVAKGTMTEAEAKINARRILADATAAEDER